MATTYSNNELRIFKDMEALSAAQTLTPADSGKTFVLGATGAAITLPAVADSDGVQYKFIAGADVATSNWTIVAASNVIFGSALVNSLHVPADTENTISLVAAAAAQGDFVTLESDGTSWYVNGSGVAAGSITFTAP